MIVLAWNFLALRMPIRLARYSFQDKKAAANEKGLFLNGLHSKAEQPTKSFLSMVMFPKESMQAVGSGSLKGSYKRSVPLTPHFGGLP
jgi:hypothetical protein